MKKAASQRVLYSRANNICVDAVLADGSLLWNKGKTIEELRAQYPDIELEDIDDVRRLWEMAKQTKLTQQHIFDLVRCFHERRWFKVSYEIVTPESAEEGEAEERGFLEENLTFDEAAELVKRTRTSLVDSSQACEYDEHSRTVRVTNGEEFETGAHEIRTLHFPRHLSASTVFAFLCTLGIKPNKTH
jgi:hypothetical protein